MVHSLKKAGICEYFHFFGSDNGYYEGKPDPHMAKDFCQRMGIGTDELLIVGDSLNDRTFAENVNARFVGIINGYGAFSKQVDSDVALISDFSELLEVMSL